MIEYVLILAFVVLGSVAVAAGMGDSTGSVWTETSKLMKDAAGIEFGAGQGKGKGQGNGQGKGQGKGNN